MDVAVVALGLLLGRLPIIGARDDVVEVSVCQSAIEDVNLVDPNS
jgi:hypothetical protein